VQSVLDVPTRSTVTLRKNRSAVAVPLMVGGRTPLPAVALGVARQQAACRATEQRSNIVLRACCMEHLGTRGNARESAVFRRSVPQRRFGWRTPPGDARKASFYWVLGWLGRQDSNLGMAESKSNEFALFINRFRKNR
jgi:hypothetical protein